MVFFSTYIVLNCFFTFFLCCTNTTRSNSQEVSYASTDEQDDTENHFYAPLTCDLCQETFTTPALWVRHTQTHELTGEMPAVIKRKRSSVSQVFIKI